MTREENMQKLVELKTAAEAACKSYNEALQSGKFDVAAKTAAEMEQSINEYTATVQAMCFEDCKASGEPMMAAVKALTYTTIAAKDEKKGEDKVPVRSIIEREKPIDLLKLYKYCGEIGADKNWIYMAQKLNCLLTAQKAVDLGLNPKEVMDNYYMTEIAREFDMGKNPTSKTNLLKNLQVVVTSMLGDGYKAVSHDVNFMLSVYSKKNRKALTVSCANHKNFVQYLSEICHRIVTGETYALDYKKKESK